LLFVFYWFRTASPKSAAPSSEFPTRLHHHRSALLAAKDWGLFTANGLDMEVILMQSALVPAALTQGDMTFKPASDPRPSMQP